MINAIVGGERNLYSVFIKELRKAEEIKIIVSFLRESGVKLIVDELKKQAFKGTEIKIITSKYLNITEPSALYLLKKELGELIELKFFAKSKVSFHPKAYFFKSKENQVLFIGSSNISKSAFLSGVEWNYRLIDKKDPRAYNEFEKEFDRIFEEESTIIDKEELKKYASSWKKSDALEVIDLAQEEDDLDKPEPRGAQIEALYELALAREEGVNKGIVVAATGVGKTYLAAFDSINFDKILFVAHREEILKQTQKTYNNINPELKITFFNGEIKDKTGDIVLASIQTLRNEDYLDEAYFLKEEFDYIIIDEFHHAAAKSYRLVLEYFEPDFLLGLTATPYRMDNKDIYELCNDNIIYEIGLKDSINRGLLVPFKYYGIYDSEVDYDQVKISGGKYNIKDLEKKLSTHKRADLILKNYLNLAGERTLGFCASIDHAQYMVDYFNENNIRAVCVHSSNDRNEYFMERNKAIKKLTNKEIDVIFAVDIFNEGVDIPALDTVLFLRPTESYVIFLQQLGRGLRKYDDKEYLKVLDFIGNYKRSHYLPSLLAGENPVEKDKKTIRNFDDFEYPKGCYVSLDFKIIDLFKEMRDNDSFEERMREEYFRLKNYLNRRPLRKDIYDGIDIDIKRYLKREHQDKNGYLRFLDSIGELKEIEIQWLDTIVEEFLLELEKTSLSKSYKLPTLLSLAKEGNLKNEVEIEELGQVYMNYYKESKLHQKDFNNKRHRNWQEWNKERFIKEALRNPVKYLCKRKFFIYDEINNKFMLYKDLEPYLDEQLTEHFLDILKYREIKYFSRRFKEEED